jgi:protein-S-isoprenylcysteine O-methyltransferase Ste14
MRTRWIDRSNWQDVVATSVGSILAVATIVFVVLFTNPRAVAAVQYVGLALFAVVGVTVAFHVYMLILPRRRKSWGYGGGLVDSGLYGVVRHPLYFGVMVACVGAVLVGQSWPVAVVAVPCVAVMYWNMLLEERQNRQRFGDDYGHYMKRVPRTNLLVGLIRLARHRMQRGNAEAGGLDGTK